jgi:hypothetical protein
MERVKDIGDAEAAEDRLMDAYSGSWPIIVMRDGQEVTLNAQTQSPGATPTAVNGASQPKSNGGGDDLQQQLNAIQQVPTH